VYSHAQALEASVIDWWEPGDRRRDGRSLETVRKILEATEGVLLRQGVSDLAIRTVCAAAGVSRGTFYRYFSSKDDLLEAFTLYERERFDRLVSAQTAVCTEPRDRLQAFLEAAITQVDTVNARQFLAAEPAFVMSHLKHFFPRSKQRALDLLAPAFDAWEQSLGAPLDRDLIADLLVRFTMSDLWVRSDIPPAAMLDRIARMVAAIAGSKAA
jgi:AcrR family transcriptional regulator